MTNIEITNGGAFDASGMLVCRKCDQPFEQIYKRAWQHTCPDCGKKNRRTTLEQNAHISKTPQSYMRWLHSKLRDRVSRKKKRVVLNLSIDEVFTIYDIQQGRCVLSGDEMTHVPGDMFNISIDRIDPDGDYEKTNIRLVCKIYNVMRNDLSVAEFDDAIIRSAAAIEKRRRS